MRRVDNVRATPPTCDSYDDPAAVRTFERAVRAYRALVEPFKIGARDGAPNSYEIVGESRVRYVVDLAAGGRSACSCPDYFANELGGCKHTEMLERAFREGVLKRKKVVEKPLLMLRSNACLELLGKGLRADERRFLSATLGATGQIEASRIGEIPDGVRVTAAAERAIPHLANRERGEARTRAIAAEIASGQLSVDGLTAPLFPYQHAGAFHLVRQGRALLADDMGLGKTVQAIAACECLLRRGEASRVVVVTPASLKSQWAAEIEKLTGKRAVIVGGGAEQRKMALASDAPYKIVNYELTLKELDSLQSLAPDILVLDEAQRAKNFRTKTAAALRALPSRFLFVLTGTPVENRLDDLYALLQLVDPRVLGPLWRFNFEFHKQNERGRIVGYKNLALLRERIGSVVLRRRKEEVLSQLPPLTVQTRYVPLGPRQTALESEHRTNAAKYLRIAEKRPLSPVEQKRLMAALLKARQACDAAELCDPEGGDEAPKLDELEAILDEIAEQGTAKVIVFSEWVEMLKLAAARLERSGMGHLTLHGGVPTEKRGELLDRFRQSDDVRVLFSSDAGGVGLNLQVASYVIHLDLPWNPARLDQRTARAHRLGQTRGVTAIHLCAESGIERGIQGTLEKKRDVRAGALDVDSTVDELDTPSFMQFLRGLKSVIAEPEEEESEAIVASDPPIPAPTEIATPTDDGRARAAKRLRLADIVLEAGFPGDATRAAYEALVFSIRHLLGENAPTEHRALSAAIFRELVPTGRLPVAAHGTLARLNDLAALESEGVTVPTELAKEAVEEARGWVSRLGT